MIALSSKLNALKNKILRRFSRLFNYIVKPFINTDLNALTIELSQSRLNNRLYEAKKTIRPLEIDLTIVSYNSSKWINEFFESLVHQTYPLSLINIFVVDNSSTDNSVEIFYDCFKKYGKQFTSTDLIIKPNLGYGTGHDAAINLGKSKYIFITNIDGELEPDALEKVIFMAENDFDEVASWELRQKPYEYPKYYDPVTLETPWSAHAAILIRRDAYERVQGFEKRIFMYGEDVELSYRLRSHGYKLKYCPEAVIWHYTYDESKVKPLQYTKSILANSYIRLRYGSLANIIAITIVYLALFVRRAKFPGVKQLLFKNLIDIAKNAKYFLMSRKRKNGITFPFKLVDYSINRAGKFVETKRVSSIPLVSVIMRITAKRQFDQLKQSILTVANQTYRNTEFIIVEDGSDTHQKKCESLCKSLQLNYKYFSITKVGRAKAGNYGLASSLGEYLMFLDDDDYLFADHIETIMSYILDLKEYVAGYSLAWEATIDKNSKVFDCKNLEIPQAILQEYDFEILKKHNFIPIQSIIFKKQLFIDRGGFDESLDYLEDWNLWYRYGYNNKFKFVPKVTSIYTITHNLKDFLLRNRQMCGAYENAKSKAEQALSALKSNPN